MVGDESAGVFAGYRIEGLIRHGGMASVYRARHLVLQRPAALKVLAPALAHDDRFRARFLGESRTAASLDHPHIVPIYDAGEADGVLYIAMRLIEGSDLGTLLQTEARLEPRRAVEILGQVAGALDAAHGRGLVHRDVKPSNILISGPASAEHAYLTDFGITKQLASAGMTATSEFLGTIAYMCPEQIEGLPLDGRADVYALGCVLHECLTGVTPFAADTVVGLMHAHLTKPPPRPTAIDPTLPDGLDEVVATAMAKKPEDRHPTCAALVDAARAALDAPRRPPAVPVFVPSAVAAARSAPAARGRAATRGGWARRWPALLAGAAALLLVTVVAAGSLRGPSPNPGPTPSAPSGLLPPGGYSPLPLTGAPPTATPTTAATSAAASAVHPAAPNRPVVVTVNASPSGTATPRPTAATSSNPVATAGPPSPTPAGSATPGPSTPGPAPGPTAWPASAATNTKAGCEPGWSWGCLPPGRCHTVAFYGDSGALPSTGDGKMFTVTVGSGGSLCARWSNPGVEGALFDSNGQPVPGVSGANAGFLVTNLAPGAYRVALRHTDPSTPDHTSLQINQS
jgi:serine/threonine-protein kinase